MIAGPAACSPFRGFELIENHSQRLTDLRLGLEQRLVGVEEAIDAAMDMVAVGIALAVLHVADERIGPVAKPQRAVGPDLRIDRAEVLVGALDQIEGRLRIGRVVPNAHSLEASAVVGEGPARHAVGVDDAGIEKLPLHIIGKLPRVEELAPHHRPHPLHVEDRVHPLAAPVLLARKRRVPVLVGTGAVAAEALPPLVEHIAPGISVARGDEVADLPGAGIENVGAGGAGVAERAPRRLDGGAHRHPFEHVDEPGGARFKSADGVVRVFRGPAIEDMDDAVGGIARRDPAVAIAILEPQDPRLVDHEDAAIEEGEAGGAVEPVVKHRAFVGRAVAIGVFEDHELVLGARITRLPLRIARHRADPQPAPAVERQLHRLGQLGKARFIREQLHLEAGGERARLDQVGRRHDHRATGLVFAIALAGNAEPCRRGEQVTGGRIVGLRGHRPASDEIPHVGIANRRHPPQLGVFAGKGLGVERAAAAIHVPAVDHPVVLEMDPRLIDDGGPELLEAILRQGCDPRLAGPFEEQPVEEVSHERIAGGIHMAAIDRELQPGGGGEAALGFGEEIDKGDAAGLGHVAGGVAIEGEGGILRGSIGEERIAGGLDGDRRDDDEPRGGASVIARIAAREVIEQLLVAGPELRHPFRARKRLIEAEEEEEGVGAESRQRIVERRVVAPALTIGHLVGRSGEVADDQMLVGEALVEERFKLPEEVHPFGGRISHQRHPLAIEQLQRQAALGKGRAGRARLGLEQFAGGAEGRLALVLGSLLFGGLFGGGLGRGIFGRGRWRSLVGGRGHPAGQPRDPCQADSGHSRDAESSPSNRIGAIAHGDPPKVTIDPPLNPGRGSAREPL